MTDGDLLQHSKIVSKIEKKHANSKQALEKMLAQEQLAELKALHAKQSGGSCSDNQLATVCFIFLMQRHSCQPVLH